MTIIIHISTQNRGGKQFGTTKKERVICGIICFTTVFIGAVLYLLFRESTYISRFLCSFLDISALRKSVSFLSCDFFRCYLPDYLWALSLSMGLCCVLDHPSRAKLSAAIAFSAGVVWEILQYSNIVQGTGDIHDIILYLAAAFTAVMINNSISRRIT